MKKIIFVLLLGCAGALYGEEVINLTTPYAPDPRVATSFTVREIRFNRDLSQIDIKVSDGNVHRTFLYSGEQALNYMRILNKADLRTNTLNKRILNLLISDGYLEGTILGNPD